MSGFVDANVSCYFCIQLLQCVGLVEVYEQNAALCGHEWERGIFQLLLQLLYVHLLCYDTEARPVLASSRSSCRVESETTSATFSFSVILVIYCSIIAR